MSCTAKIVNMHNCNIFFFLAVRPAAEAQLFKLRITRPSIRISALRTRNAKVVSSIPASGSASCNAHLCCFISRGMIVPRITR